MAIGSNTIGEAAVSSAAGGGGGTVPPPVVVSGSLQEVFVVDDTITGQIVITEQVTETLTIDDAVTTSVTSSVTLAEVFTINDTPTGSQYVTLSEVFTVDDTPTASPTHRQTVTETLNVADGVTGSIRVVQNQAEVFTVDDRFSAEVQKAALRETFTVQDTPSPALTTRRTVREVFQVDDTPTAYRRATLREIFQADDSITANLRNIVIREVFTIRGEVIDPTLGARVTVREVFTVQDVPTGTAAHREITLEKASVSDYAWPAAAGLAPADIQADLSLQETQVWTADMGSWGMSRYAGVPVRDFVGNQFGVGADGLFTYDASSDMAFVETGDETLMDGDKPVRQRKRFNYLYVYGEAEADMTAQVTADVAGSRGSFVYDTPWRSGDDSRAMRFTLGRGFASNYVRLRIGGAVTFDTHGAEVESTVTRRRI